MQAREQLQSQAALLQTGLTDLQARHQQLQTVQRWQAQTMQAMEEVEQARNAQANAQQALSDAAHDLLRLQAHGPAQAIQPMHHRWQLAQDQQSEQAAQLQQLHTCGCKPKARNGINTNRPGNWLAISCSSQGCSCSLHRPGRPT
jgi:exonuclease SbcC